MDLTLNIVVVLVSVTIVEYIILAPQLISSCVFNVTIYSSLETLSRLVFQDLNKNVKHITL